MSSVDALADPKAIGTDIESLVIDAVDELEPATDADDHYDAVATGLLCPSLLSTEIPVRWTTPLVEAGERVEIKACVRRRSNGTRDSPGAWCFKGRESGQHGWLVDEAAVYLLAVYEAVADVRELVALVVVPASIVDEHLRDRWFEVDRREGTCAQLSWPTVLDSAVVSGGADD